MSVTQQLIVLALSLAVVGASTDCLNEARQSWSSNRGKTAQKERADWTNASVTDPRVGAMIRKLQAAVNKRITARHVIEAFSQAAEGEGDRGCVRFAASGVCTSTSCKSLECVADGILTSKPSEINLTCTEQPACDLPMARKLAEKPMPGGWHVSNVTKDDINDLSSDAATIAGVKLHSVQTAYSQVVAGLKYCIQFKTKGLATCSGTCEETTCVAGAFRPLPHQTPNPDRFWQVGVHCRGNHSEVTAIGTEHPEPWSDRLAAPADSSAATVLLSGLLSVVFVLVAAALLG